MVVAIQELLKTRALIKEEATLRQKFEREATVTNFEKGYVSAPWINQEIDPNLQETAAQIIAHYFRERGLTKITGIPNCGVPLATAVSQEMVLPLAPSRKGKEIPGAWRNPLVVEEEVPSFTTGKTSTFVFNNIFPQDHLLLVDDFCALGETGINITTALLSQGVEVSYAVYAAKTFQGGFEKIRRLGVDVFYVVGIKEITRGGHVILEPPHFS